MPSAGSRIDNTLAFQAKIMSCCSRLGLVGRCGTPPPQHAKRIGPAMGRAYANVGMSGFATCGCHTSWRPPERRCRRRCQSGTTLRMVTAACMRPRASTATFPDRQSAVPDDVGASTAPELDAGRAGRQAGARLSTFSMRLPRLYQSETYDPTCWVLCASRSTRAPSGQMQYTDIHLSHVAAANTLPFRPRSGVVRVSGATGRKVAVVELDGAWRASCRKTGG